MLTLLLGATGYVGQAFTRELRRRGSCFIPAHSQRGGLHLFRATLRLRSKDETGICDQRCRSHGKPNVDACEREREETFVGNTLLPQTVARVCLMTNTPWGHISSGSIYSGAKIVDSSGTRVVRDFEFAGDAVPV